MSKDKRDMNNRSSGMVGLGLNTNDERRPPAFRLPKKHFWLVGMIALLSLGAFGAGWQYLGEDSMSHWLRVQALNAAIENVPDVAVTVSAKGEPQDTPRGQTTPEPVRVTGEVIVITPRGFEPGVIRGPAGRYILALGNRAEYYNMVIQLQSEDGRKILRTVTIYQLLRSALSHSCTVSSDRPISREMVRTS